MIFLSSYVYLLFCMSIAALRLKPGRSPRWLPSEWKLVLWLNVVTMLWLIGVGVMTWWFRRRVQNQLRYLQEHCLKGLADSGEIKSTRIV